MRVIILMSEKKKKEENTALLRDDAEAFTALSNKMASFTNRNGLYINYEMTLRDCVPLANCTCVRIRDTSFLQNP